MKSEIIASMLLAALLFGMFEIAERRYEPETLTERMVGFFVLPGELLTGQEDIYPRMTERINTLIDDAY